MHICFLVITSGNNSTSPSLLSRVISVTVYPEVDLETDVSAGEVQIKFGHQQENLVGCHNNILPPIVMLWNCPRFDHLIVYHVL